MLVVNFISLFMSSAKQRGCALGRGERRRRGQGPQVRGSDIKSGAGASEYGSGIEQKPRRHHRPHRPEPPGYVPPFHTGFIVGFYYGQTRRATAQTDHAALAQRLAAPV